MNLENSYKLAAYYFPDYHTDCRNQTWHGSEWTEWELVKRAEPRFPGHRQPRVPLWGYGDEADPSVMARKIDAAATYGLDAFIFDWYWYEDGPFLQRALDDGFLGARNNDRLKFALMWANHNWTDIHPRGRMERPRTLASGQVSKEVFTFATDHIIERYFTHPSYWRLEGRPYFSIYDVSSLVRGLGGLGATRVALDDFRRRAREMGCDNPHLNLVYRPFENLPGQSTDPDSQELTHDLGFDSVTSYVWVHLARMQQFPRVDYDSYRQECLKETEHLLKNAQEPYFPNVTVGWDPSPRTVQSDVYEDMGYPFSGVLEQNSPEEFEKSLRLVKEMIEQVPGARRLITINAWNEWTEGSYLEPDSTHGVGYLEAIRTVFPRK